MSHGVAPQFILIDEFSKRPQQDGKMRRRYSKEPRGRRGGRGFGGGSEGWG